MYLGNKSSKKSFTKREISPNKRISLPTKLEPLPDEDIQNENIDPLEEAEDETDLTLVEEIHNLNDLKPFDILKRGKKKKSKRKSSLPRHQESPISTPIDGEEYQFKTALYSACKSGNTQKLLDLLQLGNDNLTNNNIESNTKDNLDNSIQTPTSDSFVFSLSLLNEPFGEGGSTFLHVAAKEGHKGLVRMLMEHGASPCIKYIKKSRLWIEKK